MTKNERKCVGKAVTFVDGISNLAVTAKRHTEKDPQRAGAYFDRIAIDIHSLKTYLLALAAGKGKR